MARRLRRRRVRPRAPAARRPDRLEARASGEPVTDALLTGSSSIHQALRCALAIAEAREEPQPDWELAAGALGHAIRRHPERFLDKSRYSMDWYYPVLGGAVTGEEARARIDASWDAFVARPRRALRGPQPVGHRRRELRTRPRPLGGGESDRALTILQDVQHLRAANGMYWTGYVFEGATEADKAMWPEEQTSWTAGSLLLAVAALGGEEATVAVFGGERLPVGLEPDCCGT